MLCMHVAELTAILTAILGKPLWKIPIPLTSTCTVCLWVRSSLLFCCSFRRSDVPAASRGGVWLVRPHSQLASRIVYDWFINIICSFTLNVIATFIIAITVVCLLLLLLLLMVIIHYIVVALLLIEWSDYFASLSVVFVWRYPANSMCMLCNLSFQCTALSN